MVFKFLLPEKLLLNFLPDTKLILFPDGALKLHTFVVWLVWSLDNRQKSRIRLIRRSINQLIVQPLEICHYLHSTRNEGYAFID